MQLKVSLRRSNPSPYSLHNTLYNSFIRIHPTTLHKLYSTLNVHGVASSSSSSIDSKSEGHNLSWSIEDNHSIDFTDSSSNNIEFLPLEIKFVVPHSSSTIVTCYGSYNGGSCDKENVIDLPRLHPQLSSEVKVVEVNPISSIENASCVQIEPLSSSEWELLEIYANELESGGLLQQVSVVYPNQILLLKLGNDLVQVCVKEEGFTSVVNVDMNKQHLLGQDDDTHDTGHKCLRLVANTEVTVCPKPRMNVQDDNDTISKTYGPLKIAPTSQDFSHDMSKLLDLHEREISTSRSSDSSSTEHMMIPCPPLCTVWIHPDTLRRKEMTTADEDPSFEYVMLQKAALQGSRCFYTINESRDFATARLSYSNLVPLDHIALNSYLRYQLQATPIADSLNMKVLVDSKIQERNEQVVQELNKGIRFQVIPTKVDIGLTRNSASSWRLPSDYRLSDGHSSQLQTLPFQEDLTISHERNVTSLLDYLFSGELDDEVVLSDGCVLPLSRNRGLIRIFLESQDTKQVSSSDKKTKHHVFVANLLKSCENVELISFVDLKCSTKQKYNSERFSSLVQLNDQNGMLNALPATMPSMSSFSYLSGQIEETRLSFIKSQRDMLKSPIVNSRTIQGLLFFGERGCGKTHTALLISAILRMKYFSTTFYIDCRQMQSSQIQLGMMMKELSILFSRMNSQNANVLILDDLDVLIPDSEDTRLSTEDENTHQQHQKNHTLLNQTKLLSDHVRFLMDGLESSGIVVCTSKNETTLHRKLQPYFKSNRRIPALTATERLNIFSDMVHSSLPSVENMNDIGIFISEDEFIKQTEGYRPRDLQVLASQIIGLQRSRDLIGRTHSNFVNEKSCTQSIDDIFKSYTPLCHQSLDLTSNIPTLKWQDVGGLYKVKSMLTESILRPVKYKQIYRNSPLSLPRGFLVFGPPGNGKSVLIPALAEECNFNLIRCRGPELLDRYIGASEAKVRQLFEKAYAAKPSILFLDEFDTLAPRRGQDNTGVTDRIVNQLLTLLDGVEELGGSEEEGLVYIIASSSRPDKLDPALLRPGRLSQHLYVGFPESKEEWYDLFIQISKTRDIDNDTNSKIVNGSFLDLLEEEGKDSYSMFSAADIKAVFDTAHLNAVHEYLDCLKQQHHHSSLSPSSYFTDTSSDTSSIIQINEKHILDALSVTRPSLSLDDRQELSRGYIPFVNMNSSNEASVMRGFGLASTTLMKQSIAQKYQAQKTTLK